MKRIFIFLAFSLLSFSAFSQCVPDTSIHGGYSPDSATGLPHAIVGMPYSEVVQVGVPAQATISGTTYTIDSVVLTSVTGLPPGFSYSCTPSNCHLMPNGNGCLLISGPALSTAGVSYPLTINVTAYVHLGPLSIPIPQTITFYTIVVDLNSGIQALSKSHFDVSANYPNPFADKTTFAFSTPANDHVSLQVYNLIGSRIYSKNIKAKAGVNYTTLDAKDFVPGIYIVSLSSGKATMTRRMIVAKNQ